MGHRLYRLRRYPACTRSSEDRITRLLPFSSVSSSGQTPYIGGKAVCGSPSESGRNEGHSATRTLSVFDLSLPCPSNGHAMLVIMALLSIKVLGLSSIPRASFASFELVALGTMTSEMRENTQWNTPAKRLYRNSVTRRHNESQKINLLLHSFCQMCISEFHICIPWFQTHHFSCSANGLYAVACRNLTKALLSRYFFFALGAQDMCIKYLSVLLDLQDKLNYLCYDNFVK